MAGLQERGGNCRVYFRFSGQQKTCPLGNVSKQETEVKSTLVDHLFIQIKQRPIELSPSVDIADELQRDGNPPIRGSIENVPATGNATLTTLRDRFRTTHTGAHDERLICLVA